MILYLPVTPAGYIQSNTQETLIHIEGPVPGVEDLQSNLPYIFIAQLYFRS